MAMKVIGRALGRVEGESKVTGSCVYSADIMRPDALWAGFLRSPFPHARIVKIDASRAQRLPGVKAVITGKDVSPRLEGCALQDKPVLAQDRVRYIGEKVAAVAAVDRDVVEEALALIDVEYEELPAVFDPMEAMKPEALLLHPDYASYRGPNKPKEPLKNVRSLEQSQKGDVERGFAESDEIFENTFRTQMVHQGFIEPRAGLVEIDAQGRVAIWHCHQAPFQVRRALSEHADLPEEMIVVHPVSTGGSFGGKLGYDDIIITYYLARAAAKPVKLVESYAEELQDGQPRHAAAIVLRTGVKQDGRLWAWDGKIYYNGGAYGAHTPRNGMNGTFLLAGSYRTPNVRMAGYIVYTNQIPCGFFRAPGEVQTLFAVESHMDIMAKALGLDPLEFRLRNALREGDTKPNGHPLRDPQAEPVLREVSRISGWGRSARRPVKQRPRALAGRGLSLGDRHIGTGESSAEIFLQPDGSLRLVTGVRDVGVGAHTMHKMVAAEMLGVEPELVRIDVRGTDTATYDEGVRGQRGTHVEGQAVYRATAALIDSLRHSAARAWEIEVEQVEWKDGCAHLKGARNKRLGLKELARLSGNGLRGYGHCKASRPDVYAFQALVADVEVDRETGEVTVTRLYHALDSTTVINPLIHQGQIHGGVIQGLGFSLMEQLSVEDGRVTTVNFGDYKIPTIRDVPALTSVLVKSQIGPGPFGAKAVAEAGIGIVAPAIANAVYNATGVRIKELPIAAEKILRALKTGLGGQSL